MSEFMYDPESLSDALDRMIDGAPAPHEEVLLQTASRVINAPPLMLSSAASASAEAQMMEAFNNLPPSPFPYPIILGGVIVVIVIVVGVLFGMSQNPPATVVTVAATETYTSTVTASPTHTLTETPTVTPSETPAETATLTSTATATWTPTPTHTVTLTATLTQTALPTPGDLPVDTNLIVEGIIEEINGNIIVVYGIEIVIDPDEPLLGIIVIGDTIRVEGQIIEEDGTVTIVALVIEVATEDVVIGEAGEVWRDNGNCDNPPPAWAPANGWRRRCEGQSQNNGNNGNGNGNGTGNGTGGGNPGGGNPGGGSGS